ncbi:glycosyltransferase family 4 protein [Nesterenkonia halophila]|uniref:glycosyltransferase family 4 protein n=1 Tax=Nesterenkonia halophila TaxID=302044 RepID=UPI001290B8BE|nr:glycosyltransferase family 4 protein [Nesterenkonia halophila]
MRIAYLLADPGIGIFGTKGAAVHAQEMIRSFRALGHEVTVFCTKLGDDAQDPSTAAVPADLADLETVVLPVEGVKGAAGREQAVVRTAERMAEQAAAHGPHGPDLLYERFSLFSRAGARAVRRAPASRLVVEVNAPLLAEQSTHRRLHDAATAEQAAGETLAAADLVTCVSAPVARWVGEMREAAGAEARSDAAAGSPIRLVPNGVDVDRFRPARRPTSPASGEAPTIGFVGTLKSWHGTELLLEAFARTQAVAAAEERTRPRLQIIGTGPRRTALGELADRLGIAAQVEFTGAVAPEQMPRAVAALDVAVAPYPAPAAPEEHYFSPLKVYEYLAAGAAVVASDVGELPELLAGGSAEPPRGLLVPAGDVDALAAALDRLVADADLRHDLAAAGRRAVVARHSWARRAQDVLAAVGGDAVPRQEVAPR